MDLKEKFGGISRNEVRNFIEQKHEIIKKLDYETLKIDDPQNFVHFLSDNENGIYIGTFNSAKKKCCDINYNVINSKNEKKISETEIVIKDRGYKKQSDILFPYIDILNVEPDYRGKGIGEMNLGNTLDILQNRLGAVVIALHASDALIFKEYFRDGKHHEIDEQILTREYLTKLIEFYKKFGFEETNDETNAYTKGAIKRFMFLSKKSNFKKSSVFVYGDGEFSSRPKYEKQGIEIQYR